MKTLIIFIIGMLFTANCLGQDLNLRESFRCGNNIVSKGASNVEVLEKCGQPTYNTPDGGWVYDQGPSEFIYVLYVNLNGVWRIRSTDTWGKVVKSYPAIRNNLQTTTDAYQPRAKSTTPNQRAFFDQRIEKIPARLERDAAAHK